MTAATPRLGHGRKAGYIKSMRAIPYGKMNFAQIVEQDMYYVDKMRYLATLEAAGSYLMFIRPRRFGKSLFANMMRMYYDVALKDEFQRYFGKLCIGRHPTPNHSQYLILAFDFSQVSLCEDTARLEASFRQHCDQRFGVFVKAYQQYFASGFAEAVSKIAERMRSWPTSPSARPSGISASMSSSTNTTTSPTRCCRRLRMARTATSI